MDMDSAILLTLGMIFISFGMAILIWLIPFAVIDSAVESPTSHMLFARGVLACGITYIIGFVLTSIGLFSLKK